MRLITPAKLASSLATKGNRIRVLDGSWLMPNLSPKRFPFEEFKTKRIASSVFWNVDKVATIVPEGFPHMLPSASKFQEACR
jgi:3-mercaptopyruvate sulfurtransferase SseA